MQINSLLSGAVSGGYYDYFSSPNTASKTSQSDTIAKPTSMESTKAVEGVTPFNVPEVGSPLAPSASPTSVGVVDKVSFSSEALAYYSNSLSNSNSNSPAASNPSGSFAGMQSQSQSQSQSMMMPQSSPEAATYSPSTVKGVMASNMTATDVYTEAASSSMSDEMMASVSSELALRLGVNASNPSSRNMAMNPTGMEQRPSTTKFDGVNPASSGKGYATAATESFINTYA